MWAKKERRVGPILVRERPDGPAGLPCPPREQQHQEEEFTWDTRYRRFYKHVGLYGPLPLASKPQRVHRFHRQSRTARGKVPWNSR
jgi:hypothetical protein